MSISDHARRNGLLLLTAGAAVDSTSGLFSRLVGTDGFSIASGRGFFAFLFLLVLVIWRDGSGARRSLMGIGWGGLAFVVLNALGMIMNMLSLSYTAVANFFMIFATAPFAAAIAGRMFLNERLDLATLLAALAGFVGIAVMMFAGASGGGLIGDLLALGCVVTYSAIVLIVRRSPHLDILPTICLTTLASGILALPFASFGSLDASQWAILVIFGIFQLGFGNLMIFSAVSRIPAAQSGLLGILNAAFAPVWVFLFLGEVPPPATLLGGAIILTATAAHLAWTIRNERRAMA